MYVTHQLESAVGPLGGLGIRDPGLSAAGVLGLGPQGGRGWGLQIYEVWEQTVWRGSKVTLQRV